MRKTTLALGLALATSAVVALAAPGFGGGYGPGNGPCLQQDGTTCGGAGPGYGGRGGRMGGMGMGGMGSGPGGGLMTDEERVAHRNAMHGFETVAQCNAYWTAHREAMANRAKERGLEPGPGPRVNPCERMAARGMLGR